MASLFIGAWPRQLPRHWEPLFDAPPTRCVQRRFYQSTDLQASSLDSRGALATFFTSTVNSLGGREEKLCFGNRAFLNALPMCAFLAWELSFSSFSSFTVERFR